MEHPKLSERVSIQQALFKCQLGFNDSGFTEVLEQCLLNRRLHPSIIPQTAN